MGDKKKKSSSKHKGSSKKEQAPAKKKPGKKLFGAGGAFKNYVPPSQRKPNEALEAVKEVKEEQEEFKDDPPGVSAYPEKPDTSGKRISLGVDPYSIMMLHPLGREFFWSLLILLVKLLFIGLLYYDLLRDATDNNVFGLPSHQSYHVRVSQFLALLVAPYFLSDVTGALIWLGMRYEPIPGFPAATARRWYWVLLLRLLVGIAVTVVAFLLIMQSTSLTILFLNLQAILFLSDTDRLFIWLAHHGFLYSIMEKATRTVDGVGWTCQIESRKAIRAVMMIILWGILILGWTFVTMSYNQAIYLTEDSCKTFQVLMDDIVIDDAVFKDLDYNNSTDPDLISDTQKLRYTYFTGIYRMQFLDPESNSGSVDRLFARFQDVIPEVINDRLVYYQDYYYERPDNEPNYKTEPYRGKFSFCSDQSGTNQWNTATGWWIFTVDNIVPDRNEDDDNESCPGWLMKSPLTTNLYTLQDVPTDGWEIWTGRTETTNNLVLSCTDCSTNVDCGFQGTCDGPNIVGGEDLYLKCDCNQDRLGLNCEINTDCRTLRVNLPTSFGSGSSSGYEQITKEGTVPNDNSVAGDLFQITGRPIYVNYGSYNNLDDAVADSSPNVTIPTLLYAGTRWYHGLIPALRLRDDLIRKFNDQTSNPIWDGWSLFDDFDYATNPTKRGNPVDDSTLDWFPVTVLRNDTTGLADDVIVNDRSDDNALQSDGGLVVCQVSPNEVLEPYFDTTTFCDPSFLSYDSRTSSCPVDLTDFPGRPSGVAGGFALDGVGLLYDNNINTMSSYPSSGLSTYEFNYDLADTFDQLSFAGFTIHFGLTTDTDLINTVTVNFCEFGFDCTLEADSSEFTSKITSSASSKVMNAEFSDEIRDGVLESIKGTITFNIEYGGANDNTPLEIQELKLFGSLSGVQQTS